MALFYGRKKITPIINKGLTVRNKENVTVTVNPGQTNTYAVPDNYTGYGSFKVVANKAEPTVNHTMGSDVAPSTVTDNNNTHVRTIKYTNESITENSSSKVTVNASHTIVLNPYTYQVTQADLESADDKVHVLIPQNQVGTSYITIDLSVIKQLLEEV